MILGMPAGPWAMASHRDVNNIAALRLYKETTWFQMHPHRFRMQLCSITGGHSDFSCNCDFSFTEFSAGLVMHVGSCNFTGHFLLQFPES
jgi:hypothetical protein